MSKTDQELAAEILQELLKARSQAVNGMTQTAAHNKSFWFDDSHVVGSYKAILKAIKENK